MLIFVKLLYGQKMRLPVRFNGYGLDDDVPRNEAVFCGWDWQDYIKRTNGFCVSERGNCVSWRPQTIHVLCMCVCAPMYAHMDMHARAYVHISGSLTFSSLGAALWQCDPITVSCLLEFSAYSKYVGRRRWQKSQKNTLVSNLSGKKMTIKIPFFNEAFLKA